MMLVEQIWTGNAFRNFNYLIACSETGQALAIDPLDYGKCLASAKDKGWEITQVLNTHEHGDHTGGNGPDHRGHGCEAPRPCAMPDRASDGIDIGLAAGDTVSGRPVRRTARPGHARSYHESHLPAVEDGSARPVQWRHVVQCRCRQLPRRRPSRRNSTRPSSPNSTKLPDDTQVYPGHDYITNNLTVSPLIASRTTRRRPSLLAELGGKSRSRIARW